MFSYNITSAENVRTVPCPFLNNNNTRVDVVKSYRNIIVFKQLDSGDIQTEIDQMERSQSRSILNIETSDLTIKQTSVQCKTDAKIIRCF